MLEITRIRFTHRVMTKKQNVIARFIRAIFLLLWIYKVYRFLLI